MAPPLTGRSLITVTLSKPQTSSAKAEERSAKFENQNATNNLLILAGFLI
jgi:hypothetical protein